RHGGRIKLLWQHDVTKPIGMGDISDTSAGLMVSGRLNLDSTAGREAYAHLRGGEVDQMSIGYDPVTSRKGRAGTRELLEIDLWEVSLVTFPALPAARVTSVKGDDAIAQLSQMNEEWRALLIEHSVRGLIKDAARMVADRRKG